jgi:hypothetical protein
MRDFQAIYLAEALVDLAKISGEQSNYPRAEKSFRVTTTITKATGRNATQLARYQLDYATFLRKIGRRKEADY